MFLIFEKFKFVAFCLIFYQGFQFLAFCLSSDLTSINYLKGNVACEKSIPDQVIIEGNKAFPFVMIYDNLRLASSLTTGSATDRKVSIFEHVKILMIRKCITYIIPMLRFPSPVLI